jgi:putative DNA primase/helicase
VDTTLALSRPDDYQQSEGARFVIKFEKARGICGDDANPLEARYQVIEGAARWTDHNMVDTQLEQAATLFAQGSSVRDVAMALGISKSAAGRHRQQIEAKSDGT